MAGFAIRACLEFVGNFLASKIKERWQVVSFCFHGELHAWMLGIKVVEEDVWIIVWLLKYKHLRTR